MWSNVDDELNLLPMPLKASCPHLRRSCRSTCFPDVMCDLRRDTFPHEGLGSAPTSAPWDGGQPAEPAVTFSQDVICSWSCRLDVGTNPLVAYGEPLAVLAAVIQSCSLPFLLLSLLWFASPSPLPFSSSLQFKLHFQFYFV